MTEFRSNRPERIGGLRADVSHILIAAQSAADHFSAPEFHDLLVPAMAGIIQHATAALARDDELISREETAFETYMATKYGPDVAPHDEGTSYCTSIPGDCPIHPEPADVAHECGTPASGEMDTSDYPVPMTVSQRDPADPESWVFRCNGGHPSERTGWVAMSYGWQSPDYASEDDALTAAADHARAMHDGGLPNELAERVAAAERRAAERADSLIGRNVRRNNDDSDVPMVGTIHAITADPEFVMVAWWDGPGTPIVTIREAMDELTAAGGHWAVSKAAADAARLTDAAR